MPNRRAIFSSYIIPRESADLEEGVTKWTIDGAINKTLGSKSTATLTGSQWGEGWSSFQHPEQYWEDCGNHWEDMGEAYNGILDVTAAIQLNPDAETAGDNVVFLYVKNLGTSSDQGLKLSLDNGSNYGIYIPPQGSVNLRGNSLRMDNVLVNKADENTQVEFIIAI
jgi:hypothetical protein